MACSGCAQRRAAIKKVATEAVGVLFRKIGLSPPPVVGPKGEDAGRRTVQQGWNRRK